MPSSLSTDKQQELADKILERAELAQMARKLKMGLSKVVSPKKGSGAAMSIGKGKRNSISDSLNGKTTSIRDGANSIRKPVYTIESPTKKAKLNSSSSGQRFSSGLPVASSEYSDDNSDASENQENQQSRPNPKETKNTVPDDHQQTKHLSFVPSTPKSKSEAHRDINEEGADLLMYLATSPYASTGVRRTSISGTVAASLNNTDHPTTPASNEYTANVNSSQDSQLKDIVRLSHMKDRASSSSPQSTFKQPVMIASSIQDMMNSPSVSMFMSPRRKIHDDQQLLAPGTPSRIGLAVASSQTDQLSDSQAKIGSLLKTPSFNMGDYVHTLFSPSPRIDTSQQGKE